MVDIGIKVGRVATASGIPSPKWEKLVWHIDGDHEVVVRNPVWIQYLGELGEHSIAIDQPEFRTSARTYLQFAGLQILDQRFADRFVQKLFIASPAMLSYLSADPSAPVAHALRLLEEVSPISCAHLIPHVDELFLPMQRVRKMCVYSLEMWTTMFLHYFLSPLTKRRGELQNKFHEVPKPSRQLVHNRLLSSLESK